jgi:ferredoxin
MAASSPPSELDLPLRAVVDLDACAGHGRCYAFAPEAFQPDDDGYAVVVGPALSAGAAASMRKAAANCPERAISISVG